MPAFLLGFAALLTLAVEPANADLHSPDRSRFIPLRDLLGHFWQGERSLVLEQRAIQDPKKPTGEPETPKSDEAQSPASPESPSQAPASPEPASPGPASPAPAITAPDVGSAGGGPEPPPAAKEVILSPIAKEPAPGIKSPARAFLLSAALPGLGELYSGSNRGYLFLGVEAISWIGYASYRSSSNDREGDMFAFADDHFSIAAFEQNCPNAILQGQPCEGVVSQIRSYYDSDRDEYYEIISKNPVYRSGWGVLVSNGGFTNVECDPNDPELDPEEYRRCVADQAGAQDRHYTAYNNIRDDRNSLSRTARGMTMIALVNHVVSAFDAFLAARGLNAVAHGFKTEVGGQVEMDLKLKGSLGNPGARFVLRRAF